MSQTDAPEQLRQSLQSIQQLRREGRTAEAVALGESLVEKNPQHAPALFLLGLSALDSGNLELATSAFSNAVEQDPASADHHAHLGCALYLRGMLEPAARAFEAALERDAKNVTALSGLAKWCLRRQEHARALELFEKLFEVRPGNPEALVGLMSVHRNQGNFAQAVEYGTKALRAGGRKPGLLAEVGDMYLAFGKREEALDHFRKALRKDPVNSQAFYKMAQLHKFQDPADPLIRQMESALTKSLHREQRQFIHFALGKAYDDCGETETAFSHFAKANRLTHTAYRQKDNARTVKRLTRTFSPKGFAALPHCPPSPVPLVFVVGMPRSGSTLIDQVIDCHSDAHSIGESPELPQIVGEMCERSQRGFPECVTGFDAVELAEFARRYLRGIPSGPSLVVDKNPFNLFNLGLIAQLFPNAKVIHSTRNPLDTGLSCFFTGFSNDGGPQWAHDLQLIGDFHREHLRLMNHWKSVLPLPVLEVRYEDMVSNLENQARAIIEFCGLPWEPACLEFQENKRAVQTASQVQVRESIYTGSLNRWRPYAPHLQPLVDALGDALEDQQAELAAAGLKYKARSGWVRKLLQ